MGDQSKFSVAIYILAGVVVVLLAIGGIALINQSNDMYVKSLSYTDHFFKDVELKGKIAAMLPTYSAVKDGYTEALLYFTLALGVACLAALLPRLQNINIGSAGVSLTLKDLPKKLDDLIKQNNAIQSGSTGEGGKGASGVISQIRASTLIGPSEEDKIALKTGDPQKGKWGGLPERNGRKLSAEVTNSPITAFYKVVLKVESVDSRIPLTGLVHFHLHNSFQNPHPIILAQEGKAVLVLNKVTGPFTVGAEADEGQKTILELDLAPLIN